MSFLPYIPPNNFQPMDLKDVNGNDFGTINICIRNTTIPAQTQLVPPSGAGAVPSPVQPVFSFQDVFVKMANEIAQHLNDMNVQLYALHKASAGGNNTADAYAGYLGVASHLMQTFQLTQATNNQTFCKFWPLVPFNINLCTPGPIINNVRQSTVSTGQVKNKNLPYAKPNPPPGAPNPPAGAPAKQTAMYFYVTVPKDVTTATALACITFYQDCVWNPNSTSNTDWISWGFVTGFALNMYETVSSDKKVASSSSSSSLYAASSSMPGNY